MNWKRSPTLSRCKSDISIGFLSLHKNRRRRLVWSQKYLFTCLDYRKRFYGLPRLPKFSLLDLSYMN